jgi:hypothetical protein
VLKSNLSIAFDFLGQNIAASRLSQLKKLLYTNDKLEPIVEWVLLGRKHDRYALRITVSFILFFALILSFYLGCVKAETDVWQIHDVINPSIGQVSWSEEGVIAHAPSWIADGTWYQASMTQSLVGPSDIFVSTYEMFNWTLLQPTAEELYGANFVSVSSFQNRVIDNPSPWLNFSWSIDTNWYGVPLNTTRVIFSFNSTNSTTELWMWFHITHTPEYLVGQGNLENLLTGFDLTPISVGSLSRWELYKDYNEGEQYYNLHFEAPANILSQHSDNYTLTLPVSTNYQGYTFKINQIIDVNMPANTEIKQTFPSSKYSENTATFIIARGDEYPSSYKVISGSPAESLAKIVQNDAIIWFTTPGGWAAFASLLVLSITGLRGRTIWRRNKLYHHLYKSMVTLYDLYSQDLQKFRQEMEAISASIFKMLIEDKITDEQFEKLLKRRDDLLERSTPTTSSDKTQQ